MSHWHDHALIPDWPAPPNVRACVTTRAGGTSLAPYASLNLGDHVGDNPQAVAANRALLAAALPNAPLWLNQVHGVAVVEADRYTGAVPEADAAVARVAGTVCAVMTADCLPVVFARRDGTAVGAAHAGWRGLHAGVLEATAKRLGDGSQLIAWMGPAIGPDAFEVGEEVREAFTRDLPAATAAFRPGATPDKWWADIYLLARLRLATIGLDAVYGGGLCTVRDAQRFYSYRRDKTTGRMATMVWMQP
ncbi:peptidoglycan editing factor PgeF [Chitinimonas sp. BJYL2]|uniref:peptidoglycan editing factor PgeF n=1 Tax=Chitinimonas sp. BJYL2 TaxID=2976696 RepID=UPI0022B467CB|nr:peptidoglycan editing factor PgeF [Chitinimonas sp. BJYL2]